MTDLIGYAATVQCDMRRLRTEKLTPDSGPVTCCSRFPLKDAVYLFKPGPIQSQPVTIHFEGQKVLLRLKYLPCHVRDEPEAGSWLPSFWILPLLFLIFEDNTLLQINMEAARGPLQDYYCPLNRAGSMSSYVNLGEGITASLGLRTVPVVGGGEEVWVGRVERVWVARVPIYKNQAQQMTVK